MRVHNPIRGILILLFFLLKPSLGFTSPSKWSNLRGDGISIPKRLAHWTPAKPTKPTKCETSLFSLPKRIDKNNSSTDNNNNSKYWYDSRIHTLGNVGLGGGVHAASALVATKSIDHFAYDGINVRAEAARQLWKMVGKGRHDVKILDLCCGVGMSTRALGDAFPRAEIVVGVDTSPQMLAMARFLTAHRPLVEPPMGHSVASSPISSSSSYSSWAARQKNVSAATAQGITSNVTYALSNAEHASELPDQSLDLVTIMFAFHEIPTCGRERILREARRVLRQGGTLAIVDITSDYQPSASMLSGEPYIGEYQKNIHQQLRRYPGFGGFHYRVVIPGHVAMWTMKKKARA